MSAFATSALPCTTLIRSASDACRSLAVVAALAAACGPSDADPPGDQAVLTAQARRETAIPSANVPAGPDEEASVEHQASWTAWYGWQDVAVPYLPGVRGLHRGAMHPERVWAAAAGNRVRPVEAPQVPARVELVVIPVGGVGSGAAAELVSPLFHRLRGGDAEAWSRGVEVLASHLAEMHRGRRVFWQLGNEINSESVARALGSARADDPAVISPYVEAYLAPTVSALRRIPTGEAGPSGIVLGTIANANRPRAVRWLDSLLSYRVEGTYATELRGQRVADLVDVVAVHYVFNADDDRWIRTLDGIHDRWLGEGRVRAVWSTEEVGARRGATGLGAATALRTVARSQYWWSTRGLSPEQARLFFWGGGLGPPGARAADALDYLYTTFAEAPLSASRLPAVPGTDVFALETSAASLIVVAGKGTGLEIGHVALPPRLDGATPYLIEARHFGAGRTLGAALQGSTVRLTRPLQLTQGEVVTVLLANDRP